MCKEAKPRTSEYFPKRKDSKDGLRGECRECRSKYQKQYYEENKEELLKKDKLYYEEYKEKKKQYYIDNKEKIIEYRKKYYLKNSEQFKKKAKQYRQNNKEQIAEYKRYHYQNNPDIYRLSKQRRAAKRRRLLATLTQEQWGVIKDIFNNSCAYCGMSEGEHLRVFNEQLHQEHFIPLSEGGEYTHNNIIPACRSCNTSKNNSDFFKWYPEQEFYSEERESFILIFLGYKAENIKQLSIL